MLKNSSELQETIQRLNALMGTSKSSTSSGEFGFELKDAHHNKTQPPPPSTHTIAPLHDAAYRDERLDNALARLIQRGGFTTALILDNEGLVLSSQGEGDREALLSALAAILGGALDRLDKLFDLSSESAIQVDLSLLEKAVLKRFRSAEQPMYLLVVCPHEAEVPEELEVTIYEVRDILD